MEISQLVERAHADAKSRGFTDDVPVPEALALIHSEVSEALEEYRKSDNTNCVTLYYGEPSGYPIELADIVIRVAHEAGRRGIDLQFAIQTKLEYNQSRPHKHGKRF